MIKKLFILFTIIALVIFPNNLNADTEKTLIYDEIGLLEENDKNELTDKLVEFSTNYGVDLVVAFTQEETDLDILEYASEYLNNKGFTNAVGLVANYSIGELGIVTLGDGKKYVPYLQSAIDATLDLIKDREYVAMVNAYIDWAIETNTIINQEKSDDGSSTSKQYIYDELALLDEDSKAELEKELAHYSNLYDIELVVAFVDEKSNLDIGTYSAEYLESKGYRDVIGLVVNYGIGERGQFTIVAMGEGQKYSYYLSSGEDYVFDDIKNKNYKNAIDAYIYWANDITSYVDSGEGDSYSKEDQKPNIFAVAIGSLAFGAVVSGIYVSILRAQLITEGKQVAASNYSANGLNLTNKRDIFLYSTYTRTKITKNDNNNSSPGGFSSGSFSSGSTSSGSSFSSGGGRSL